MTQDFFFAGLAICARELTNTFFIYFIFRQRLRFPVLYYALFFALFFLGEMGFCLWRGALPTVRELYAFGIVRIFCALFFYRVSWSKIFFATGFLAYNNVLQNNVSFTAAHYYQLPFAPEQTANILIFLINVVFAYPLICLLKRFGEYLERTSSTRLLALASFVTYSFLAAIATQHDFGRVFNLEHLIARGLVMTPGVLFLAVMLYLLQELDTNRRLSQEVLALQELYDKEHDYYSRVEANKEEARSLLASIRQNTAYMLGRLEAKQYGELEEYFNSLLQSAESLRRINLSGHPVVDAVVGYWQLRASEQELEFSADIHLNQINIDDQDLAIVLGNALENAYTAACQVTEGPSVIRLNLTCHGALLIMIVENSFNGVCVCRDGQYYSAKRDFAQPGTGIANIRLMVEKYQGYSDIILQEKRFVLQVGLLNRRMAE